MNSLMQLPRRSRRWSCNTRLNWLQLKFDKAELPLDGHKDPHGKVVQRRIELQQVAKYGRYVMVTFRRLGVR